MCMVSAVLGNWANAFPQQWPQIYPDTVPSIPTAIPNTYMGTVQFATKQDIDALRQEILELKELLLAAKKFDDQTNQPDCEEEAKVALIKAVAKVVGIDMNDIFQD